MLRNQNAEDLGQAPNLIDIYGLDLGWKEAKKRSLFLYYNIYYILFQIRGTEDEGRGRG